MLESPKRTVNLDSTIPSYLFDKRESLRYPSEVTRRWWQDERPRYDIYVSAETIVELGEGEYPGKEEVLAFAAGLPVLESNRAITEITGEYIRHMVMPNDASGDALHLAYASYYGVDFLLTWNCAHLANANKRRHIETINRRLGLFTPAVITPLELFGEY